MTSAAVGSIISTMTADLGGLLADAMPTVLVITGALIGLTVLVRFIKRFVK